MTKRRERKNGRLRDRALATATTLFGFLCSDLEQQLQALHDGRSVVSIASPKELSDLAVRTQKALQTVLDLEIDAIRAQGKPQGGAPGAASLDLGAARDEIESRLARLAGQG
ncbi:MAG: hypothetical protein AAF677_07060 [Pseudomonadota bacterium]